jgi:hypothetical protein
MDAHIDLAAQALLRHLNRMPLGKVHLRPAVSGAATHDIEVWFYDKFVGVAKVTHTERRQHDIEVEGWTIPVGCLSDARKAFYAAKRWTKRVVLLLITSEHLVYLMDMSTLARDFASYEKTDDGLAICVPHSDLIYLEGAPF